MPNYWLLKTEPADYAWEDLWQEGKTIWDGVRSPAALQNLRYMQPGDLAFIYHTGRERAVAGIARITGKPYPDPRGDDPRLQVIDLQPLESLPRRVSLQQIKESGLFPDWELVRRPRLSVVPVSPEQWKQIRSWAEDSNV